MCSGGGIYDDGIARRSTAFNRDRSDAIQLAWDDAQLAEWLNRQVTRTPAGELEIDAPNGVAGYRLRAARRRQPVEFARADRERRRSATRTSLARSFKGEGIVEVVPL
jgi:hypothetical protein